MWPGPSDVVRTPAWRRRRGPPAQARGVPLALRDVPPVVRRLRHLDDEAALLLRRDRAGRRCARPRARCRPPSTSPRPDRHQEEHLPEHDAQLLDQRGHLLQVGRRLRRDRRVDLQRQPAPPAPSPPPPASCRRRPGTPRKASWQLRAGKSRLSAIWSRPAPLSPRPARGVSAVVAAGMVAARRPRRLAVTDELEQIGPVHRDRRRSGR